MTGASFNEHAVTGAPSNKHAVSGAVFALLAAIPPVAAILGQPFIVLQATQIMIMGLAALSLDLILGYGGMVSFGHAAFVGIGAYVAAVSDVSFGGGADILAVAAAAVVLAGVAALLIGLVALRVAGVGFIMITLAFAQMIYYGLVGWQQMGGDDGQPLAGRAGLLGIDLASDTRFFYLVLLVLAVCFVLARRLVGARFGMVLQGARQNSGRLAALGIDAFSVRLAAFVIAGAIAGLAGALRAEFQYFASPADASWIQSGELVAMVVLGGIATLLGPLLGAAAYLLAASMIGAFTTHWPALFGPLLILVVLFAGGGVLGGVNRLAGGTARRRNR